MGVARGRSSDQVDIAIETGLAADAGPTPPTLTSIEY